MNHTQPKAPKLLAVPKDYLLGPVFAATPQKTARWVQIGERKYQIGGFHPFDPKRALPALDVRHARAIFTLLSFRIDAHGTLRKFTWREYCMRHTGSYGGKYAQELRSIVADLIDSFFLIRESENETISYRIIQYEAGHKKDGEDWQHYLVFTPGFMKLMGNLTELATVRIDVFNAIRSPLAQSIYLYIPSRAHHHTEASPFEITLTRMLEQVSASIPEHKSERKRLFTQNRNSIIAQLDGREVLNGKFRVRLAPTGDGKDYKLQCWVERAALPPPPPQDDEIATEVTGLRKAFLKNGQYTADEMARRLSNIQPLSGWELDVLTDQTDVEVEKNMRCWEVAKALLTHGTKWHTLICEESMFKREGNEPTKNATARFIFHIKEALENQ